MAHRATRRDQQSRRRSVRHMRHPAAERASGHSLPVGWIYVVADRLEQRDGLPDGDRHPNGHGSAPGPLLRH
eukprot:scaffold25496_cov130-Isochrysis_galbana.AAC.3